MKATLDSQIELRFGDCDFVLRGDGTAFLPRHNALLVADLHLGKDASFRAAGIPVPAGINLALLAQLSLAIEQTAADSVYILGDMIHDARSMTDEVIDVVLNWRKQHAATDIILVRGNHDRHVADFPEKWQLNVQTEVVLENFELRHIVSPQTLKQNKHFQIGGHWHPVVTLGRGADRTRFPCFVVEKRSITLPAFGPFKGGFKQQPSAQSRFYPICEGKIWISRS
ncbi:ligase-associated DNA damage response endonuclease PdeM [Mariniblastus fucicola]|uniref:Calcineurin-like phosphoesterase n=1 Tax=Mariniblastus fucicola TaxID=980251 RepID=A0A5B9PEM0_9BACT|nr:ligase-associated DNA damage response endonuclease PdeM [Mariniblastus fucicola]QEG23036.1 Calcineurin-like phosphoesterase [Mariniblastus fucicola]